MSHRAVLAVLVAFCLAAPSHADVGDRVAGTHTLRDVRGNRRPLADFKGNKAIVVAFVGAECPVSNLYLPEVVALEKKYRDRSVLFLAVYPNHADDLDVIAGHSYDRDVPGEDERALQCYHALMDAMNAEGYLSYRLGTQAAGRPLEHDNLRELLGRLKSACDPAGVLAPGRYGLDVEHDHGSRPPQ